MIRANSDSNCLRGRLYYHDFLQEQTRTHIPQSDLRHIVSCRYCQSEIDRLRSLLGNKDRIDRNARSARTAAVTSVLKLHFAYVGRSVTCNEAKPFLAGLADPVLKLRIPTPITAHVDNCPACSDDLATIRAMALGHKQLCRLGRLLADKPKGRRADCRQAAEFVRPVAQGDLRRTNARVLGHLCTCSHCRQVLYERREELLRELSAQGESPCEGLSPGDLFEYCLPYGIDPAEGLAAELEQTVAHVSACPACLEKVQSLHKTICGIAERSASSVATRFTFQGRSVEEADLELEPSAADWAVNVELYRSVPEPQAQAAPLPVTPKQTQTSLNLMRLVRPVAIAAAAVLLVSVLFLNTSTAKGVDLNQVYAAIAKIKNVCITRFQAGKPQPYQREWVLQTLNIRMFQNTDGDEEFVLWDIANGVKIARSFESRQVKTTQPGPNLLRRFGDAVANSFGLMPFATMADVPKDAKWTWVSDPEASAIVPGTDVYDLTWLEVNNDKEYAQKMRYWVDRVTDLPTRVESFRKKDLSQADYGLTMTVKVEYPTDAEIQALIKGWFGEDSLP